MDASLSGETLAVVAVTFVVAGLVKGVVGLGLPTVALGLLTATLGLVDAMALMLLPSLVTNIWQGFGGRAAAAMLKRLWALLAMICVGVWIGAGVLARSDATVLAGVLGLLLCAYAVAGLTTPPWKPPGRHEGWLSPAIGIANGVLTGMTGSFTVPAVPYLQTLGLSRDALTQAMGIVFTVSTLALAIALKERDLLPVGLGNVSLWALAFAVIGMVLGQRLRRRIPEAAFRRVFLSALLALGLYIAARSFI